MTKRGSKHGPRHSVVPSDVNQENEPMGTLAGAAPPWMEAWAGWHPSDLDLKRFPHQWNVHTDSHGLRRRAGQ